MKVFPKQVWLSDENGKKYTVLEAGPLTVKLRENEVGFPTGPTKVVTYAELYEAFICLK